MRQFFRKLMPFLLLGTVAFGGYHLYQSSHRRGGTPSLSKMLYKVPVFGSYFRSTFGRSKSQAYRGGGRANYRRGKKGLTRRKHGRKARRRRR